MNILFVTLSLSGGGAERVVSVLANGICKNSNLSVGVLTFQDKQDDYHLDDNVKRIKMPKGDYLSKLKRVCFIRTVLKSEKPDYIIPFLNEPLIYTYFAHFGMKASFVSTIRNNPSFYSNGKMAKLIKYCTEHAKICMLQTVEQLGYYKIKNYFVVPNPINDDMFQGDFEYRSEVNNIITCGRLTKQKNHAMLINSMKTVVKEYPNLVLHIYGEGEERSSLENLIVSHKLQDNIILEGRTNCVKDELMKSDLFILSSDYEGLPNALMEAMAVGLPCISTSCPTGPKSLITQNVNGCLVDAGDEKAMSEAILYYVKSFEQRRSIGVNAKESIRNTCSLDAVVNTFIKGLINE